MLSWAVDFGVSARTFGASLSRIEGAVLSLRFAYSRLLDLSVNSRGEMIFPPSCASRLSSSPGLLYDNGPSTKPNKRQRCLRLKLKLEMGAPPSGDVLLSASSNLLY